MSNYLYRIPIQYVKKVMKYEDEKLKAYTTEIRQRIESVLPAKDKEDMVYRMYFGKRKNISQSELWDFIHWYNKNDSAIRAELCSNFAKQIWMCNSDWTNIRKNSKWTQASE